MHDVSINYVKRVKRSPGEPLSLLPLSPSPSAWSLGRLRISLFNHRRRCRCCCRCCSLLSVLWRFKRRERERERERERVPRRGSSQPRRESSWETRSRVRRRPWCRKTVRNIGTVVPWIAGFDRRHAAAISSLSVILRCPEKLRLEKTSGGSFGSQ